MIEWYRLIVLASFMFISLFVDLVPLLRLQNWSIRWQTSLLLLGFLLIYLPGLLLVSLISRYIQSVQADSAQNKRTNSAESLNWPVHLILAILLLIGFAFFFFMEQLNVNPAHLAILALTGVAFLLASITSWHDARQPPLAAQNLTLTPGAGFIQISWTPPNDLRYAECLVVRTIPPHMPAKPEHGQILYRGVFNTSWRDKVEPGERYLYTLFTHDGQERYQSTTGHTSSALPLPNPPINLNYIAERNAIALSWKLVDSYNVHLIRLVRRAADVHQQTAETWEKEIARSENWRDSGLPSGTRFDYEIYIVDIDGQQSEPATMRAATLAEPLAVLNARVVKRNQVALSWELPLETPDFQEVVVNRVRADSGDSPETIYKGIDKQHIDRDRDRKLAYDTTYIYSIQARYLDPIRSEPKETRITTRSRPDKVQSIQVEAKRRLIHLRWQLPEHEEVRQVKLERQGYSARERKVLLEELATEYKDFDVTPEMPYIYWLSIKIGEHWSAAKEVKAETLPPPQAVSNIEATWQAEAAQVALTWQLPDDDTIIGTRIVRKQKSKPADHTDGEIIHDGVGTRAIDRSVVAHSEYYYAFFTYDDEQIYSYPVLKKVETYVRVLMWFYYANLNKREQVRLPIHLTMQWAANRLLKKQGVDLTTITGWSAIIEQTGREIVPSETLEDAGIQPNDTIRLTYQMPVTESVPPIDEQSEESTTADPSHPSDQAKAERNVPEDEVTEKKETSQTEPIANSATQAEDKSNESDEIEQAEHSITNEPDKPVADKDEVKHKVVSKVATAPAKKMPNKGPKPAATRAKKKPDRDAHETASKTPVTRTNKPSSTSKGEQIELFICYQSNPSNKKPKRLSIHMEMQKIVDDLLKEQGVNVAKIMTWMAIVEETGKDITPTESLQDAGVQPGQTINLIYF